MDSLLDINNLSFNDSKITIILDDKDEPWFYGNEIGDILGYNNTRKAIRMHVKEKYVKVYKDFDTAQNGTDEVFKPMSKFINEHGLYQLIMKSKLPIAEQFQDWVFEEVLPSIRKHGEYKLKKEIKEITNIALKLKQITLKRNIEPFKKSQYIYIASTNLYSKQNYFKVGGTITKIKINNKRLSGYNIGRPDEDNYFYFYVKECNNYKIIEDKLNIYLKNFKPNDKKEMYNILLEDLIDLIETLINNNNMEVEYMNTILPKMYNNLIDNELGENFKPVINDVKEDESEETDIENPIITFVTSNTLVSQYGKVNKKTLFNLFCKEYETDIEYKEFNKIIRDVLKFGEKKSHNIFYWTGITMLN